MRAVLLLMILAACDSPAPQFMGAQRTEVTRDGRTYVVHQQGEAVEVIRLGYARRGEHAAIRATMIDMIPVVTGCALIGSTVKGDSGELRARVNCPNR